MTSKVVILIEFTFIGSSSLIILIKYARLGERIA
jgi:hypothetical protein